MVATDSPDALSDAERRDRLRLIRSENVGPVTWRRLIDRYGSATRALAALPALAAAGGRRGGVRIPTEAEAEAELAQLSRLGARMLVCGDRGYPARLATIEDPPATVSVIGDGALFSRRGIAIVGSRNASVNGRRLAERLAADLGKAGFVIVSGLARGIDGAAHAAALATGTIAVVAGGIDVVYPQEHVTLHAAISRQGAVVAEMPPGANPQARHFPRRNRIIAGLAEAVLVVEAAMRSGSLITARFALEQGREVFAVPGSPLDSRSQGSNDLIRQGATLTETADDVLRVLGGAATTSRRETPIAPVVPPGAPGDDPDPDDAARQRLAEALSPSPVPIDDLIRLCRLPPAVIASILLEWELAGRIERHAGNRVSLLTASIGWP
jgi:DNA protecting protein DprA